MSPAALRRLHHFLRPLSLHSPPATSCSSFKCTAPTTHSQLRHHSILASIMGASSSQEQGNYTPDLGTFYQLKAIDIDGKEVSMSQYAGKPLMVVNVASACGKTDGEYKFLSELYSKWHPRGFEILAFPCNQFLYQESGSCTTIKNFIKKYNVEFPMFDKINVNGGNTHPIYEWLKKSFPGRVTWNFSGKFFIDHKGIPRARANDNFKEIDQIVQKLVEAAEKDQGQQPQRSGREL